VAEKFQAMVALDMLNSRMKDFFDLWAIAGAFACDGPVLTRAIQTTFERRATPLPTKNAIGVDGQFRGSKAGPMGRVPPTAYLHEYIDGAGLAS
jgi:hypothetical protein